MLSYHLGPISTSVPVGNYCKTWVYIITNNFVELGWCNNVGKLHQLNICCNVNTNFCFNWMNTCVYSTNYSVTGTYCKNNFEEEKLIPSTH